jgi:dipeptidyl aminopeptidase/acylaminoacyl peptidase
MPEVPPLIPRRLILGNPARSGGSISPDGRWLGFCAPVDGVMNVWVAPADRPDEARSVTADTHRGVRIYGFAHTGDHLLYLQDTDGDENTRLYVLTLSTGEVRPVTPAGARAELAVAAPERPTEVVVTLNDRDPQLFDVVIVDLVTGGHTRILENDRFGGFVVDRQYAVRFAYEFREDGGITIFQRQGEGWVEWLVVPQADSSATQVREITQDGRRVYLTDSRDRDTSALFVVDLETGERTLVHEDARADVDQILVHPVTREVVAVSVEHLRPEWTALDPATERDFAALRAALGPSSGGGDAFTVVSRTRDLRRWVVVTDRPDAPVRTHLYDRETGKTQLWFDARPELAVHPLPPMHPVAIRSREGSSSGGPNPGLSSEGPTPGLSLGGPTQGLSLGGPTQGLSLGGPTQGLSLGGPTQGLSLGGPTPGLEMPSYLTLPIPSDPSRTGLPSAPLPMVLLVHGGPWWRDRYEPNPWHTLLADRGYAVLSPNFRGSTGFGKAFVNAGDREWGRKMHDDLLDAVAWAIDRGIADPDRVAIMGGSYGGYAALAGLTLTPEVFACGVDLVGPSSLITFMETIPPYWEPARRMLEARVGNPRDEAERAMLIDRSPLSHVDAIRRPLLIAQGANDPRVKKSESDQIVAAMEASGIGVTYLLYPDEGHGFVRPENNLSFAAVTEAFLARWLGGRFEPVGDALSGSSVQVVTGAELISGLPG